MGLRSIQSDLFDYLSYYAFNKKNRLPTVEWKFSTTGTWIIFYSNKSFQHCVRFSDCFWFPILTPPSQKALWSCHPEELHQYLWEDSDNNGDKRSIDGGIEWSMASLATHHTQSDKHCFRNLHRKDTNINCCARVISDSNFRNWQGGL